MTKTTTGTTTKSIMSDDEKIRISSLWETLKRYDVFIGSVNFKSGLLASLNVAIFGGILLKVETLNLTNPFYKWAALLSTLIIVGTSTASLFWIIKSIWPNLKSSSTEKFTKPSMIFFGSVANNFSVESFKEDMSNRTTAEIEGDLCTQIHEVAYITKTKFDLIAKAAFYSKLTIIGLLALAITVTLNHFGVIVCQG